MDNLNKDIQHLASHTTAPVVVTGCLGELVYVTRIRQRHRQLDSTECAAPDYLDIAAVSAYIVVPTKGT